MLNMPAHFAQACLGVGALILRPASGAIVGGSIRTHVHNATISATIRTTVGVIKFSVFVHATRQLVVVQDLRGSGGEQTTQLLFDFVAAPALSPVLFEEHGREWLIFTLHWPSAAGMEWQARATRARSCRALPCSKYATVLERTTDRDLSGCALFVGGRTIRADESGRRRARLGGTRQLLDDIYIFECHRRRQCVGSLDYFGPG